MTYKKRVSTNPDIYEVIDRENIQYGDYIQYGNRREAWQENKPVPVAPTHKTRVKGGELMELLGPVSFGKVYRAAYPTGANLADDNALFFLERAKMPISDDGLIDIAGSIVDDGLTYFVAQGYITEADKSRVQLGVVL